MNTKTPNLFLNEENEGSEKMEKENLSFDEEVALELGLSLDEVADLYDQEHLEEEEMEFYRMGYTVDY
jgi:hypothetical protein